MYYLKARYYDPETGRFVSSDDVAYIDHETIGGVNLYVYCGNNPVMKVDPYGTSWKSFWKGVGFGEVSSFVGWNDVTFSTKVDFSERSSADIYEHFYIRTLPALGVIVLGIITQGAAIPALAYSR